MKITLCKIGNLCGRMAPVLWALVIIFGGSLRPEYSHFSQYISEVGCVLPRLLLNQKLHSLSAGVGFFALIGASLLWGIVFRRYQNLRNLSVYSFVSGCLALLFLALMSWSAELRLGTGVYERLSTGLLSLWMLVLAVRLWRLKAYIINL